MDIHCISIAWLAGTFPTAAPVESLTAQAACSLGSIRAATRRVPLFQLGGQLLCVIEIRLRFRRQAEAYWPARPMLFAINKESKCGSVSL